MTIAAGNPLFLTKEGNEDTLFLLRRMRSPKAMPLLQTDTTCRLASSISGCPGFLSIIREIREIRGQ